MSIIGGQSCTYPRRESMSVIAGPCQLDERTEGGALEKWSDAHALLEKGLGSVANAVEEAVGWPLVLAEPVVESGGLSNSAELW